MNQDEPHIRKHIVVKGCVQGVGFRPTVYRHARACALNGFVLNALSGVVIEVEGPSENVERFLELLTTRPPPQARIDSLEVTDAPPTGDSGGFVIRRSERSGDVAAGMPPDLAICADCERELFDPADRRYRYAFINCTNCGPRFTIIRSLPYDRARTSMSVFPMCPECAREYNDPADRRFDAQPNACPVCGPRLILRDVDGAEIPGDPLERAIRMLRDGRTIAVKGLGGFHLACLACDDDAVAALRAAKSRPHKPFAVMFRDIGELETFCLVHERERNLLLSPARPIVVVRRRDDSALSQWISPDTVDVGAFLPYTPLHLLLLSEISPLVMTSANRSEEPIVHRFEDLRSGLLGTVAAAALDHDREIVRRCDDSVVRVVSGRTLPIRRSRGYVPAPVRLPLAGPSVVACGGELKNTFCVTRGADAFLSQHVGDLVEWSACRFYEEAVHDLIRLLEVTPALLVHDLHPDYVSTRFALEYAGAPLLAVQHHHAHIASCAAENGCAGPVIGVALDGTGYGPDGTVWGGEFLVGDIAGGYRRAARLEPVPLPGGDAAVRHPARMAWSVLLHIFPEDEAERCARKLLPAMDARQRSILRKVISMRNRSPLTSSAGRLFDAVSALLGLCDTATYEGQAAIRLETCAEEYGKRPGGLAVEIRHAGNGLQDVIMAPAIRRLVELRAGGAGAPWLAALFHASLADAVVRVCCDLREETGLEVVALSGGVFQNALLLSWLIESLESAGFRVLRHTSVPPNDAGISLGQAAIGLARLASENTRETKSDVSCGPCTDSGN